MRAPGQGSRGRGRRACSRGRGGVGRVVVAQRVEEALLLVRRLHRVLVLPPPARLLGSGLGSSCAGLLASCRLALIPGMQSKRARGGHGLRGEAPHGQPLDRLHLQAAPAAAPAAGLVRSEGRVGRVGVHWVLTVSKGQGLAVSKGLVAARRHAHPGHKVLPLLLVRLSPALGLLGLLGEGDPAGVHVKGGGRKAAHKQARRRLPHLEAGLVSKGVSVGLFGTR
mmetsp:Transcript_4094/g.9739  ORF Transcript_4094/g.9739 Transcript_4094/m.9739 type:complete len:224 (-) Transcript_4094:417-1088(-)